MRGFGSVSVVALLAGGCAVTQPETSFVDLSAAPVEVEAPPAVVAPEPVVRTRKRQNKRVAASTDVDAVTVFPYEDNRIYQVRAGPGYITALQLEPGEMMPGKAAIGNPDPADWIVEKTTAGAAGGARVIVLVKPGRAGLGTNLVLATNRRVYQLDVTSTARRGMDIVRWSYPAAPVPIAQPVVQNVASFDPELFSNGYSIEVVSGESPRWKPTTAYYTGSKTYIEFPAGIGQVSAPALFSLSQDGRSIPVQFRVRGRFYEIDAAIAQAELRQGETVVRIRSNGNG